MRKITKAGEYFIISQYTRFLKNRPLFRKLPRIFRLGDVSKIVLLNPSDIFYLEPRLRHLHACALIDEASRGGLCLKN